MAIETAAVQRATQRLLSPFRRGISTTPAAVRSAPLIDGRRTFLSKACARPWLACSGAAALRPRASVSSVPFGQRNGQGVKRYSTKEEGEVPSSRIYSFEEIKELVEKKDPKTNFALVDVREPGELLQTGRIPGAINIPITSAVQSFHIPDQDFEDMYGFPRPAKDADLVFYCRSGVRARSAAGLAKHAGWESVGEYTGSWLDWDANKGPVEKI